MLASTWLSSALVLATSAWAQPAEGPTVVDEPADLDLAIPVEPPRSPPRPLTIRVPQRPPASAAALQAYRDRYLAVVHSSRLRTNVAPTTMVSFGLGPRGWGGAYIGVPWPAASSHLVKKVRVVQGQEWLEAPETLGALGEKGARRNLERRIQRSRHASAFLQGMAVVGVGGIVAGLVGTDHANQVGELRAWQGVAAAGIGLTVAGMVGSSVPSRRADQLQFDITRSLELDVLNARVASHNKQLAEELGLDPKTAIRLESHRHDDQKP